MSKIVLSSGSASALRTLKGRTGLTHQYLCRLAFCHSLAQTSVPNLQVSEEDGIEFNRYTLTGEWDRLFFVYLAEWCAQNNLQDPDFRLGWFKAHINRGLSLMLKRVRTLSDVGRLVQDSQ